MFWTRWKYLVALGAFAVLCVLTPQRAFAAEDDGDRAAQGQADAERAEKVGSFAGRVLRSATTLRRVPTSRAALVPNSDVIDFGKLITEVFEAANRRRDELQAVEPNEKRRLETAKRTFAEKSKNARNAKRAAEQDLRAWEKAEKQRIKQVQDRAQREAADRQFKAEHRSRRNSVNHAERDAHRSAKTEWQLAQQDYKAFQQELKNARFEAKTMPKYEKKMKPELLTALKKLNDDLKSVTSEAATAAAGGISIAVVANLRPDIVRGYLKYVVGERVRPVVEGGVDKTLDKLFVVLDKVASIALKAIVAAVGSIPFVGGALAAVAAQAGEMVYAAIKNIVTNSVRKVGDRVSTRLIAGMTERLLSIVSVKDTRAEAVIAAILRAVEESNSHLDKASQRYTQKAAVATAQATTITADAAAHARKLAAEAEADQKAIAQGEVAAAGGAPVSSPAKTVAPPTQATPPAPAERIGGNGAPSAAPAAAASPPSPKACGALDVGAALKPGEEVRSCNGRYNFVHQTDGNVVLYDRGRPRWDSKTYGQATRELILQGDGNLVLYGKNGRALWHSATHGKPGAKLAVQDDGNVVLYRGGAAIWATNTNP